VTITDFTSDVAKVRALIPDIEELPHSADPSGPVEFIFSNAHLQVFLDLNEGSIRYAAADACEVLGTSEALILKVITTEDLSTDGAKLMAQYMARAAMLRTTAIDEVDGFNVVPYYTPLDQWFRHPEGVSPWGTYTPGLIGVPVPWL
jgi:hypothetical protein